MKDLSKNLFFCGIGGSGMSALATLLQTLGYHVSGSDRSFDQGKNLGNKTILEKNKIKIFPQDGSGLNQEKGTLIVSTAVEPTIPDVKAALQNKWDTLKRAELLAKIFHRNKGISIAGTSGKSTITAMVGWVLHYNKKLPTIINGGYMQNFVSKETLGNSIAGTGDYTVIEADESDGTIQLYNPYASILSNISLDHKPMHELKPLFIDYCNRTSDILVLNDDCHEIQSIKPSIKKSYISYSLTNTSVFYRPKNIQLKLTDSTFTVDKTNFKLNVPGEHNISNALAATALCHQIGLTLDDCSKALNQFQGVARRFTVIGQNKHLRVIDDFAHNAEKIDATLKTVLTHLNENERLIAIYQPHGFAPTRMLKDQFIQIFSNHLRKQDLALFPEIFYAGGTVTRDISSKDITDGIIKNGKQSLFFDNRAQLGSWVKENAKSGDTILIMGARDDTLTVFAKEIFDKVRLTLGN